jgi:hypothetical protein
VAVKIFSRDPLFFENLGGTSQRTRPTLSAQKVEERRQPAKAVLEEALDLRFTNELALHVEDKPIATWGLGCVCSIGRRGFAFSRFRNDEGKGVFGTVEPFIERLSFLLASSERSVMRDAKVFVKKPAERCLARSGE